MIQSPTVSIFLLCMTAQFEELKKYCKFLNDFVAITIYLSCYRLDVSTEILIYSSIFDVAKPVNNSD